MYPWGSAHLWGKDKTCVYLWRIRALCVPALTHCSLALLHNHGYGALSPNIPPRVVAVNSFCQNQLKPVTTLRRDTEIDIGKIAFS